MRQHDDEPMYRTFEEFEREELRRADSIATVVDDIFEELFVDELTPSPPSPRRSRRAEEVADDEEE